MAHASTHGARKPPGPKYGGNKISASGVSLKWVKSNRRREKKRERKRAKVGDCNGQYPTPEPIFQPAMRSWLVVVQLSLACLGRTEVYSQVCYLKFWSSLLPGHCYHWLLFDFWSRQLACATLPPLVAVASVAGHCYHWHLSLFFLSLSFRSLLFTHFGDTQDRGTRFLKMCSSFPSPAFNRFISMSN